MKLRIFAAAIAMFAVAACTTMPDGSVVLNPSARAKLETASKWAHRFSAGAHLTILGISSTCEGRTSNFCAAAMPIIILADGALKLYDAGLVEADKALASTGTPEEQLAAAAAGLIKLEGDVEDYLADIKVQKSELDSEERPVITPLLEQAQRIIDTKPGS